ncbi:CDP-alcohol phosphatidyltransferase family protein [Halomonas borealis]|uniref:CDP-alcohol phosphatidyltransferase family protein n=1 Tax=Halomonas borealis TaxID=2508710 RepID=UPI00109F72AA|nr:CDP-alcohol phosphatidyltransferase family protein [Halomonas borealis]
MTHPTDRRPLASRDTGWARRISRRLARTALTPNQVSRASMLMALVACLAFWASAHAEGVGRALWLVVAVLGCQARLLCNLFDGMLAIESGKASPTGALWNEAPDRVADLLILVGAGLAIGVPSLGWAAAAMAILTAYVRAFGDSLGHRGDFGGPMAKPQRMAVVTLGALIAALAPLWGGRDEPLWLALWIILLGGGLTAGLRVRRLHRRLREGGEGET